LSRLIIVRIEKMKRTLLTSLVLLAGATTLFAEESPENILEKLVAYVSAGRTNEAESCYVATNDAQREEVRIQIRSNLPNWVDTICQPLRSFKDGDCALVGSLAICTNSASPKCTAGFSWMIHTKEGWRLMPSSFKRSPEQHAAFQRLVDGIEPFEHEMYAQQKAKDTALKDEALKKQLAKWKEDKDRNPNKAPDATQ